MHVKLMKKYRHLKYGEWKLWLQFWCQKPNWPHQWAQYTIFSYLVVHNIFSKVIFLYCQVFPRSWNFVYTQFREFIDHLYFEKEGIAVRMINLIIPYGPLECRPFFGVILAIFIIQSLISVEKGQLGVRFGLAIKDKRSSKVTYLLPVRKRKGFWRSMIFRSNRQK